MDSNQGKATDLDIKRPRIEDLKHSPCALNIKPVAYVRRRIRSDWYGRETVRKVKPLMHDWSTGRPDQYIAPSIKTSINPQAYEYYVQGIGWMSAKAYRQFKKALVREGW